MSAKQNWKEYQWGDLVYLEYGKSLRDYRNSTGHVPVYGTNGPIGFTENALCQFPSVVIGRKGAYRGVHYSNQPFFVIDTAFYIKPKVDFLNLKFCYYYLKTVDINSMDSGSAIPSTSRDEFYRLPITLPDLGTQNEIAQILSSLDDKIELNLQINATLEKMAQTIFYERFGKYKPGDNLPKGWKWTRFGDELEVVRGLSYKGAGLTDFENGVPMHNLNSVFEGGGYKRQGIKFYKGDFKKKHLIEPWDIIVTNTEQGHKYLLIGYPAWVPQSMGQEGIFSHHLYRVRPLEGSYLTSQFIYRLIMLRAVREQIIGATNGTTVNMLKIDGLQLPEFPLPPKDEVDEFSYMCKNLWMRQEALYQENESLIATRDSLLPRLMSGKIELN